MSALEIFVLPMEEDWLVLEMLGRRVKDLNLGGCFAVETPDAQSETGRI